MLTYTVVADERTLPTTADITRTLDLLPLRGTRAVVFMLEKHNTMSNNVEIRMQRGA
jgi:hypothetical protein